VKRRWTKAKRTDATGVASCCARRPPRCHRRALRAAQPQSCEVTEQWRSQARRAQRHMRACGQLVARPALQRCARRSCARRSRTRRQCERACVSSWRGVFCERKWPNGSCPTHARRDTRVRSLRQAGTPASGRLAKQKENRTCELGSVIDKGTGDKHRAENTEQTTLYHEEQRMVPSFPDEQRSHWPRARRCWRSH
jgi:hypothetical protein